MTISNAKNSLTANNSNKRYLHNQSTQNDKLESIAPTSISEIDTRVQQHKLGRDALSRSYNLKKTKIEPNSEMINRKLPN